MQFTRRRLAVKPFSESESRMTITAPAQPRFVRRTMLGPNEYRKNFRQIDGDVIATVTSPEADRVTPLMSKIYLRLVNAPARYWERDGVLRFEGQLRGEVWVTAWEALCETVGVASATANKALRWMHAQGIVGYFAGKNGVGIRVFINRAASSIGTRAAGKKILEFTHASSLESRTSTDEVAFSDSFADPEVLETDLNPRAPKNGAGQTVAVKKHSDPTPICSRHPPQAVVSENVPPSQTALRVEVPVDELVSRLRRELEPSLQSAARRAAAQEHERTREWLESRGLPKAARVAQREAFNMLCRHGLVGTAVSPSSVGIAVGRNGSAEPMRPRALSSSEVKELAETCVAMLAVHGQSIDVTLAELSAETGGVLLAEDVPKVRELARALASGGDEKGLFHTTGLTAGRLRSTPRSIVDASAHERRSPGAD